MVIYQVCCFNLHKDRPQSNSIQLKLEQQTPASHLYAKLVACKVGPGRFIQQYRRIKIRHGGKQYDNHGPQLFVFYSCISSMHRPGSDATIGNVACNFKKILTLTQDLSRRCIATRGGECVHVPL